MSSRLYSPLYMQLQELIAQSDEVCSRDVGGKAQATRKWIKDAHDCLALLEDQLPTTLADFRRLRAKLAFRVDEDDARRASESAYRPEWIDEITGQPDGADLLIDFSFPQLQQVADMLKLALRKLKYEGHSVSESPDASQQSLPSELRSKLEPLLNHYSPKQRGPKADVRSHLVICNFADSFGDRWRAHIADICRELDRIGIQAPPYREHDKPAPSNWVAARGSGDRRLVEIIQKDIKWCRDAFPDRFAETFPNLSRSKRHGFAGPAPKHSSSRS